MRVYDRLVIFCVVFQQCASHLEDFGTTQTGPKQMWNETTLDKLKKDLFMNYDKYARPQQHYNSTNVKFGMAAIHLETNELKSTVTISSWLRLVWTDSKLKWNESDYGGISVARIAEHEIWQPDIFLYNSVSGGEPITKVNAPNVLIYPNGEVLWVPTTKLTVLCEFNLRHWPFDTQHCFFKFGSWTHNGNEISIQLYNNKKFVDVSDYTPRAWIISNTSAEQFSKMYDCCLEPYHEVLFNLTLVRNYQSYKALIVTPAVAITLLILMQFWLPLRAEERLILNCLTLIVDLMFLLYFTNHISAAGSNTPIIVIFYSTCLFMMCLTMATNILIFTLFKKTRAGSLPWVMKKYLQGNLGKFLLLNYYFEKDSCSSESQKNENEQNPQFARSTAAPYKAQVCSWKYNEQDMLTLAMDRIFFIVYSVVYIFIGFIYLL
ncbi:hypothetical protein ILUMI_06839 [Ignelater luminosus]|uniref:Neurotransmitter-gated ion-channel ligand-binding domain-containing protein n=1 Tax=Ignelater luminosus TaxID=2038154 RepID=A0A8K0D4Z3_IGNLU|nr:hypothetical protein ILUMI_06839 [Ignelater luminosus]